MKKYEWKEWRNSLVPEGKSGKELLFAENGPFDPSELADPDSFIGKLFRSNGQFFIEKMQTLKE